MDPDSPVSRMERTLWTFWCYITEAVNRFLRPQPADTINNDPNVFQESGVDSEPPGCGHTQADSSGGEVDVERRLATLPLLSSSSPVVAAWEVCTTEIDLRSDEETTQLRRGNESKGESKREEQVWHTGNDDAGLLVAKDNEDEVDKTQIRKVYTCGQGQTPKDDEEDVDAGSSSHIDDMISEGMEKSAVEEEAVSADTPEDHQKMDEATTEIQVSKDDGAEDGEELEDRDLKLCTITDLGPEEEESLFKGKEADKQMTEVQVTKDVGTEDGEKMVEEDCEVKLCTVTNLSPEKDTMLKEKAGDNLDDHQNMDELKAELQVDKGDETKDREEEDEEEDREVNFCTITDLSQEEEESIFKGKAVDHQKMTETTMEAQVTQDDENKDKDELEVEHHEVKLCTITDLGPEELCTVTNLSPEKDSMFKGKTVDYPDDHQKTDEATTEVQVTKDDINKDREQLDEEEVCEVKLYTVEDLSPEEDSMLQEKAAEHLDDQQKMDEMTDDQVTKGDGNKDREELEVEDCEATLCSVTNLNSEYDSMFEEKATDQLDDHQKIDETATEVQVSEGDGNKDGEELENHKEKLCTVKDLRPEEDSILKEKAVDHLDDHQKLDDTTTEVQVTKDNVNKDGEELDEEEVCEVKLYTVEDLSPEEDSMLKEKAAEHLDDQQKMDETATEVQVTEDDRSKDREELDVEDCEAKLYMITDLSSEEERSMFKENTGVQRNVAVRLIQEETESCDGAFKMASEDENKSDEGTAQDENQPSVCEEFPDVLEDELIVAGRELRGGNDQNEDVKMLAVITEEEDINEAAEEEPDMENNSRMVTDGRREEDNLTQYLTCSQETVQKTLLYTNEFADKEDVVATDLQTTSETEATVAEMSLNEKYVDKNQVEEESEFNNNDNCMENVCTATSLTVKPEGETEQEISREFKNIPLRIIEGQVVVLQELNTPECEERQEGVPELNGEFRRNENTTQRFLKGGNCEEIQITQLPEEVESKEQESLKNSGTGASYLFEKEHSEETQDSKEDCTSSFDFVVELPRKLHLPQEAEDPCVGAVDLESGHLFEKEEIELLETSMKTDIKHKELETHFDSADEADKTAEELQNATEFEIAGALQTEQNNRSHSMPEDITENRFLKQSVELLPKLSDDCTPETQSVDTDKKDEEEEDKTHQQVAGEEDGESELSLHFQAQQMENQSPNKALEMNEMEIKVETEEVDETKTARPNDLLVLSADETAEHVMQSEKADSGEAISSVRGHQDVIDEEILDLWIEAVMSEDTCETEQEGSEAERKDTTTPPINEKPAEILSLMEKGQLMESHSVELAFVSDTETSSSAVESGFLDQSFSETELVKSASTSSLQDDTHDTWTTMSESATGSVFSAPNSESQDVLLEETAEIEQSSRREEKPVTETESYSDSGVSSPQTKCVEQESRKSQEKPFEESAETEAEMVAGVTATSATEEANVTSLITMNAEIKEETLEVSTSDFLDVIKHTGSGQWGDDSEASLEQETVSTEPDSQSDSEKKLSSLNEQQRRLSKDIPESICGLSRAEVAEECTSKSEDQCEVDAPVLNFTVQRSRIAVKNPRVRPPTNPRSLLNMPSADPTPTSPVPVKMPAGVPLGGLGIGIKLPGLGAGLPVLKKTKRVVRDEDSQETPAQEPEKKAEEKSDAPKRDEAQHRPKWMPPGHAGFGNPLMSELKTKLKKTT